MAYRWRRGQLVEIPAEWVGQVPTRGTIRDRPSKLPHKQRKTAKHAHIPGRKLKMDANAEAASLSGQVRASEEDEG